MPDGLKASAQELLAAGERCAPGYFNHKDERVERRTARLFLEAVLKELQKKQVCAHCKEPIDPDDMRAIRPVHGSYGVGYICGRCLDRTYRA